jgi:hypothetical protein
MRSVSKLLLAGAAAVCLTGLAMAASVPTYHEMTVQMPDGGVAHIRYTGRVAPKVSFGEMPQVAFVPGFFAPDPMFAALDRMTADMNRRMAGLLYQADLMQRAAQSGALDQAAMRGMPAGSNLSFISTASGNGFCMKTTQITATPGGKPKVVSKTSGNCSDSNNAVAPSSDNVALHAISAKTVLPASEPRQRI